MSPKEVTNEQFDQYREHWLDTLGQRFNPEVEKISDRLDIPSDVVKMVDRLRQIVSVANFAATKGSFSFDNDSWPKAKNPKKGPAPIVKLATGLAMAEQALDDIFWPLEGQSLAAQLLQHFFPREAEPHIWVQSIQEFAPVAAAAASYKRDGRGRPSIPDWVVFAAGYANHRDCTEEQFHELMFAFDETWSIEDSAKKWAEAKDDTKTDYSDPIRALVDYQDKFKNSSRSK